jgi:glycosyltransferase involved in cell wall biosynthesis
MEVSFDADPRICGLSVAATFSIVIPTLGRATLIATLKSLVPQLESGDEILLIRSDDHDWGAAARNSAMERARGSHLIFIDDDDEYTPEALRTMREFATRCPDRIGIFRMRWEFWDGGKYGRVLWREPKLEINNVSTQMFLVPNIAGKIGQWDSTYGHDYRFIAATVALQGDPVFCDSIVVRIRPDRRNVLVRVLDVHLRLGAKRIVRRLYRRRARGASPAAG